MKNRNKNVYAYMCIFFFRCPESFPGYFPTWPTSGFCSHLSCLFHISRFPVLIIFCILFFTRFLQVSLTCSSFIYVTPGRSHLILPVCISLNLYCCRKSSLIWSVCLLTHPDPGVDCLASVSLLPIKAHFTYSLAEILWNKVELKMIKEI